MIKREKWEVNNFYGRSYASLMPCDLQYHFKYDTFQCENRKIGGDRPHSVVMSLV